MLCDQVYVNYLLFLILFSNLCCFLNYTLRDAIGCKITLWLATACATTPNRTDIVARGGDNALWIRTYSSGTWTSWQSLGGVLGSAPAITSWGPNRLDVFAKGSTDNYLYVKSCTANCSGNSGSWTNWEAKFPNGAFLGRPAVVGYSGAIDIFDVLMRYFASREQAEPRHDEGAVRR